MAKLPIEITDTINSLKQQLLNILEEATGNEFTIFDNFGESETTIHYMEEMSNVANESESWFNRLSTLQLRIAKSQPIATRDLLDLMSQTIAQIQARIPALSRSNQEVKQDWNIL